MNFFDRLTPVLQRRIGQEYVVTTPDVPLKMMAELAATSKTMHNTFQPVLDAAKLAKPLLKAVVEGDPVQLSKFVQENPQYLFKKGQIKDPSGQVFYNVSAYQMIKYLCDDDMLATVMPLIPEKIRDENRVLLCDLKALQKEQDQTLYYGGADLIKLNFDPINAPDFDRILKHAVTYRIDAQYHSVTFSLMENPDAILYYKDAQTHWYYANWQTRTIERIQPQSKTEEEAAIFSKLTQSMNAMENNSARRSNYAEHDIIAKTMNKRLVRNGIQYEQDGKRCCDTHHDFNRYYNAYREYIRLYDAFKGLSDKVWCEKLGSAQKEVMWLLQRYCENRLFFPPPNFKSSPFLRSLKIVNLISGRVEDVYCSGHFVKGLSSDFAIYKGAVLMNGQVKSGPAKVASQAQVPRDLIAVNRLVEDAKANVIEFKLEEVLSQRPSTR